MKITITPEDIDKALAVPWETTNCVVAQAIIRQVGVSPVTLHDRGGILVDAGEFELVGPVK